MRVLIVDDHWAVRDGLRWAFSESSDVRIVGAVSGSHELSQLMSDGVAPDVIVLDIQLEEESGLDILAWLRESHPDVFVVMLSMHDDPVFVRRSIELGAHGYVLKSAGSEELARALDVVAAGDTYIQGEVTKSLLESPIDHSPHLSPRELEIISLIADGLENKQIARRLEISETTVKTHLRSAFDRLQVTSRSEAVATALRHGLID